MNETEVKFVKLNARARVPEYATAGAAGADLRACLDAPVEILPRGRALIPTGLAIAVPEGCAGLIYARSGLAYKSGVAMANGVGVVDSDYTGEIKVALINTSDETFVVRDGDRVAQLVFSPVLRAAFSETEKLADTARAGGGFGSTGVK
ncbi:MAG: dUTP diphosphatase [Clostridia bacterium]|nr:dUTP diphosphatase [Clostridia bacterium]